MRTSAALAAFAAVLGVAFAAAYGIGAAVSPIAGRTGADEPSTDGPATGHQPAATELTVSAVLPGLAAADAGYTFVPRSTTLPRGADAPFEFTITGSTGQAVDAYTRSHEKDLHLIVVRRDLEQVQHVHPTRRDDGTWQVALDLPGAGTYRAFADFQPAALGRQLTLGTDLFVAGEFAPAPLPAPATTSQVDGYDVTLDVESATGKSAELVFTVAKGGRRVDDLQPYLGAFGHLVSLRVGDLAYLHTHPAQEAGHGDRGGPQVRFVTEFLTAGSYRLFLDFKVGGVVRTAAFTVAVPPDLTDRTSAPTPVDDEASGALGH